MIRAYLRLTKPGVMLGNLITTVAGFLFAANGTIDWVLFIATTAGTALVISSACVINNYLDRDIDAAMERTKTRPLITGEAQPVPALIFGIVLGLVGIAILSIWTNWLVVTSGAIGFVTYVWLYGALSKRRSVHGTLVGSVSGAIPILAGYLAVSGRLDAAAALLFAALFFWQMPEFYSIAIYRQQEYAAAHVPVITIIKGITATKRQIFWYTIATAASILALGLVTSTSATYTVVMLALTLRWLHLAVEGLIITKPAAWAKRMFHYSLVVLLGYCFVLSAHAWLP